MGRIIDAEVTTKTIADWCNNFDDTRHVAEVVDSIPTVEAQPYVIEKSYAKEQIVKELEETRYIQCPYDQCDEMYDAWCKAFEKSKDVVNRLLS